MTGVTWPTVRGGRTSRERLRAWSATTPGRLRLIMGGVVIGAALAALVVGAVSAHHRDATDAVATRDEPLMVAADRLYASLSDADATAATTFVTGGIEPAARRARYLGDLRRASLQLAQLAERLRGSPEGAAAVAAIAADLPVYSGLMESARANNRQGFPVGAAYLRQASDLLRGRMLPAAGRLFGVEAERLGANQRGGTSVAGLVGALVACAAAVAGLVAAQIFLTRRTHRVFNIPLAVATVLVLALAVWVTIALAGARGSLSTAQREGSDPVQVLSAARILALRAQADESLALVARGGGDQYLADYRAVSRALAPPNGLLGHGARLFEGSPQATAVADLATIWQRLGTGHARLARLEADGSFGDAVRVAVGTGSRQAQLTQRLNSRFDGAIAAAQQRFDRSAADARSSLRGLTAGILLVVAIAALLALYGLQQRIAEYR